MDPANVAQPLQHCSIERDAWIGNSGTSRLFYLPNHKIAFRCMISPLDVTSRKIEGEFAETFDPKTLLGNRFWGEHKFEIITGMIPQTLAQKIFNLTQKQTLCRKEFKVADENAKQKTEKLLESRMQAGHFKSEEECDQICYEIFAEFQKNYREDPNTLEATQLAKEFAEFATQNNINF